MQAGRDGTNRPGLPGMAGPRGSGLSGPELEKSQENWDQQGEQTSQEKCTLSFPPPNDTLTALAPPALFSRGQMSPRPLNYEKAREYVASPLSFLRDT